MERYEIDNDKLEQVKGIIHEWNAALSDQEIEEFIDADWPEGEEHQDWLDSATPEEIANWVIAGQ